MVLLGISLSLWERVRVRGIKKEPPVVRAALRSTYSVIYFTLTVAILTENCPLIIRTTRTTTIRVRVNKDGFMGCIFRPIIGGNGNKSRG
jgi:hypothetical protein